MFVRFAILSRIPKGVWVLGGVSLLMDVSSEMIHSLLPLFMATTLGASVIIFVVVLCLVLYGSLSYSSPSLSAQAYPESLVHHR